jgi:inositol oxygenase
MGKIMFKWGDKCDGQVGTAEGPQWALGGDTWVVGCKIPESAIMPHLNGLNPDMKDSRYKTECGIYKKGCGLSKLTYAYGHDEYMYRMLKHNKAKLPKEAFAMIRYHSCYPLHKGGAYKKLLTPQDEKLMVSVRKFNEFDLYTKAD